MYQSTLITILFQFFLVAFSIGTIWMVIKAIKGYTKLRKVDSGLSLDSSSQKPSNAGTIKRRFFIKVFIVFGLWFLFSLYIFVIDTVNSIGDRVGDEPLATADSRTLGIIAMHVLWFLAGLLLIYWLGKAPKPPAKLP